MESLRKQASKLENEINKLKLKSECLKIEYDFIIETVRRYEERTTELNTSCPDPTGLNSATENISPTGPSHPTHIHDE